jgi:hypothetical protein
MTVALSLTTIWQCEVETDGSVSLKSLANPRPMELTPGLSGISHAPGEPGLTTNRAIAVIASERAHL